MKKIKIFLASSIELLNERNEIDIFISRENNKLVDEEIFIQTFRYEIDGDTSITPEPSQDKFNSELLSSDIAIILIHTKVGIFTKEEFDVAFKSNQLGNNPKFLYVYFKPAKVDIDNISDEVLAVKKLKEEIKKYQKFYGEFKTVEDLINKLKSQFDKIIPTLKDLP